MMSGLVGGSADRRAGITPPGADETRRLLRKAYVVSTFDMVNIADLDLLRQVRDLSDEMVVAVLGDDEAARLHGRAPVVPESERLGLVRALRGLGDVVLCRSVDEIPSQGCTVYTDEELLARRADVLLTTTRRSASSQLRNALDHGCIPATGRAATA